MVFALHREPREPDRTFDTGRLSAASGMLFVRHAASGRGSLLLRGRGRLCLFCAASALDWSWLSVSLLHVSAVSVCTVQYRAGPVKGIKLLYVFVGVEKVQDLSISIFACNETRLLPSLYLRVEEGTLEPPD